MFTELPKLLERDFAVGYFLPVATFAGGNILLFISMGWWPIFSGFVNQDLLLGSTLFGLFSWLCAIFLMVTNREIIRTLEGYGRFNLLKLFHWLEKFSYNSTINKIEELDKEYKKASEKKIVFPQSKQAKRQELLIVLAEQFPDDPEFLLPTRFGNVIRSFEVYPRVMYGIESIQGWSRLLTIVPKDYLQFINSAKSMVDFWLNVGVLSFLFFIETLIIFRVTTTPQGFLIYPGISLFITWLAAYRGTSAAVEWGDYIKATFDVYLIDLQEKLALEFPKDRTGENETWMHFSQALVYRRPDVMPKRAMPDKKKQDGG